MTFAELAKNFENSQAGTDDFKTLFRGAYALMKSDPPNASLYFIIGVAAQNYVLKYEDQAVEIAFADKAKATFVDYNRQLVAALGQDAGARLSAASAVAADYEWNVRDF